VFARVFPCACVGLCACVCMRVCPVHPTQVFLHILECVLAGLEHMHTLRDVVGHSLAAIHYDVKPDNVLVFPAEHDDIVGLQFKVSDLGATRYTTTLRRRRAEDPGHVVVKLTMCSCVCGCVALVAVRCVAQS
jgi:serine/threonine protein kinase